MQSIYGMTELIFYLVRLLAIVVGVVIIQSYYAAKLLETQRIKQALEGYVQICTSSDYKWICNLIYYCWFRTSQIVNNLQQTLTESEFNASSFIPGSDVVDSTALYAYTNYGMLGEQSK